MALGTVMQRNVRTVTMRAFGREEMDKIIGSLPYVEDPAAPDL